MTSPNMTKWYPKFRAAGINPSVWDRSLPELNLEVLRPIFADGSYLTPDGSAVSFAINCKKPVGTRALRVAHTFAKALITKGVVVRCASILSLAKSIREVEAKSEASVDNIAEYLGTGTVVIYDFDDVAGLLVAKEFVEVCDWLSRHYYRGGGLVLVGIHGTPLQDIELIDQDLSDIIGSTFVQVEVPA